MYSSRTKYMRIHTMGAARMRLQYDKELTTKEAFKGKTGDYSNHRKKVHQKWVEKVVESAGQNYNPPVVVFMGGGSGSGKSFVRSEVVAPQYLEKGITGAVVDVDKFKVLINKYERKRLGKDWANRTHDEGIDVMELSVGALVSKKKNFILDGTLSHAETVEKNINFMKSNGYKVNAVFVDVGLNRAMKNVQLRQKADKYARSVPLHIVKETNINAPKTFLKMKDKFDDWEVYNNEQFANPVLIASKKDGIINPILFAQFIAKGMK